MPAELIRKLIDTNLHQEQMLNTPLAVQLIGFRDIAASSRNLERANN